MLLYLYICIYIYDIRVYPVIHVRWDSPEDRDKRVYVQDMRIRVYDLKYICMLEPIYIYIYMNM